MNIAHNQGPLNEGLWVVKEGNLKNSFYWGTPSARIQVSFSPTGIAVDSTHSITNKVHVAQ